MTVAGAVATQVPKAMTCAAGQGVSQGTADVSAAEVRAAMTERQRQIARRYGSGQAERPGIVMVGRDIDLVVDKTEAGLKVKGTGGGMGGEFPEREPCSRIKGEGGHFLLEHG